jgi:hypothetical protein
MSKECACGEINNVFDKLCHTCGDRLPEDYTDYRGETMRMAEEIEDYPEKSRKRRKGDL